MHIQLPFPGDGTQRVVYTYTLAGQTDQVRFLDSNSGLTALYDYDYDSQDRLTQRTDLLGSGTNQTSRSIQYGYDIANRLTAVTTASGATTYTYDEQNRLDTVSLDGDLQADYGYDALGNLTQTQFGNGTTETRQYDLLNRLTKLENTQGSTVLSSYEYTLDRAGNRLSVLENTGRKVKYTYDNLYRLTQEKIDDLGTVNDKTFDYTYDKVGNRKSKYESNIGDTYYTYDANDRLTQERRVGKPTDYAYDNNGNMLSRTEKTGYIDNQTVQQTDYGWDYDNRLVWMTNRDGSGTLEQWANYRYNDQGIRVSSTVNGVETRYLLDEGSVAQVWEEYAPNGQATGSYVYGHDLIRQSQAGQESFYLVDGLGSTRVLTDQTGAVLNRYTYDAFGKMLNTSGSAENKYLFAGEQFDEATGDYYLRQRYYDADSGRFTRRDAYEGRQGEPLTLHKYMYADANPVNGTDPAGLFNLGELNLAQRLLVYLIAATAISQLHPLGRDLSGLRGRSKNSYNTADDAARAAIQEINQRSITEGKEYGGAIAQSWITKKYFYTKAKPGNGDTISQMEIGLAPLDGFVIADYHTHGRNEPGYDNENFSDYPYLEDDDKDTNRKGLSPYKWPLGYGRISGYLGTPSGKIKKYDPWNEKVTTIGEVTK